MDKKNVKIRPASAAQKNRLMLVDIGPKLEPLMTKIKSTNTKIDKEKIFDDNNKLRHLVNSYHDEVGKHKTRIRQHLEELNKRDELIMELTAGIEKPGYKNINVIAELSRRLRMKEMLLEDSLVELETLRDFKKNYSAEELKRQVEQKNQDIEYLKNQNNHIIEEIKKIAFEKAELEEMLKKAEETLRNSIRKEEFERIKQEFLKHAKEKEKIIKETTEKLDQEKANGEIRKKSFEEIERINKAYLEQIQSLKDELKEKKKDELEYKKNIEKLKNDIDKAKEDHSKSEDRFKDKIKKVEDELDRAKKELEKTRNELSHSNKEEERSKNELDHARKELERLKNEIKDLKTGKEIWESKKRALRVVSGEALYCFKADPLNLPPHLQHFLFGLQIKRICLKDIEKELFGGVDLNSKIDSARLAELLKDLHISNIDKPSIMTPLVKDLTNSQTCTIKTVIINIKTLLGDWDIYEEKEEKTLETELLRVLTFQFPDIYQKCKAYNTKNSGIIRIHQLNTSLLMAGVYLHPRTWGYLRFLIYSIDHDIEFVNYEDFFEGFLENSLKLSKDDKEGIAKHYMELIANHCKKHKINTLSPFISEKNKISSASFYSGCKSVGLLIKLPIVKIILSHYGKQKKDEFFIKKNKFREALKKFELKLHSDSSSSSSDDSDKADFSKVQSGRKLPEAPKDLPETPKSKKSSSTSSKEKKPSTNSSLNKGSLLKHEERTNKDDFSPFGKVPPIGDMFKNEKDLKYNPESNRYTSRDNLGETKTFKISPVHKEKSSPSKSESSKSKSFSSKINTNKEKSSDSSSSKSKSKDKKKGSPKKHESPSLISIEKSSGKSHDSKKVKSKIDKTKEKQNEKPDSSKSKDIKSSQESNECGSEKPTLPVIQPGSKPSINPETPGKKIEIKPEAILTQKSDRGTGKNLENKRRSSSKSDSSSSKSSKSSEQSSLSRESGSEKPIIPVFQPGPKLDIKPEIPAKNIVIKPEAIFTQKIGTGAGKNLENKRRSSSKSDSSSSKGSKSYEQSSLSEESGSGKPIIPVSQPAPNLYIKPEIPAKNIVIKPEIPAKNIEIKPVTILPQKTGAGPSKIPEKIESGKKNSLKPEIVSLKATSQSVVSSKSSSSDSENSDSDSGSYSGSSDRSSNSESSEQYSSYLDSKESSVLTPSPSGSSNRSSSIEKSVSKKGSGPKKVPKK